MRTLAWIAGILPFWCCAADGAPNGQAVPERPNIVLFLVDDMGRQDTSLPFYTETTPLNKRFHTPNMDALAEGGMMFTQGLRLLGLLADAGEPDYRPQRGAASGHQLASSKRRPERRRPSHAADAAVELQWAVARAGNPAHGLCADPAGAVATGGLPHDPRRQGPLGRQGGRPAKTRRRWVST